MKNLTRIFQTAAALFAVFAMPHLASAIGSKGYTISQSSTAKSVTDCMASNATCTITIAMGSGISGANPGVMFANLVVSPSGAGVAASLSSTGPFTTSGSTARLP